MKDFIILCAKIALGVLIAVAFIFGGTNSMSQKSRTMKANLTTQMDTVTFSTTGTE